ESFVECVTKARELGGDKLDLESLNVASISTFGDPVGLPGIANTSDSNFARLPPEARSSRPWTTRSIQSQTHKYSLQCSGGSATVLNDGKQVSNASSFLGAIHCACFAADETVVAVGCEEGVIVWSLPGLIPLTMFRGSPKY